MNRDKKLAWIEAISDTTIGTLINFPLNFLLLSITFSLHFDVLETAIASWGAFTVISVLRKFLVRRYFSKKIC